MISFTLSIAPVPKGRPVFGNGHARTPAKTRAFERAVATLARAAYRGPPLAGPIALTLAFYLPRPKRAPKRVTLPSVRPDLDNFWKGVSDALNGIVFTDDGQVCDAFVFKRYGSPRIEVRAWCLGSETELTAHMGQERGLEA